MTETTTEDCTQADMISWIEILNTPREQLSPSMISPRHLRSILRATFDVPHPPQDPQTLATSTELESQYIDLVAWLLWAEMGIHLFAGTREETAAELPTQSPSDESVPAPAPTPDVPDIPPIRRMVRATQRVAVMLAMVRHKDNLTHAAAALGISRRSLREILRRIRVYPWSDFVAGKLETASPVQTHPPDHDGSVPDDDG